MATVVLTAVGTALGGPIGGAVGGLIGNAFDHAVLFRPKGRTGPRLSDLQVQTSTYGTQMPRLYGTMRVAGTVIWASDLKETSTRTGGGKGRGSVTSYSYSASFAVALSARAVRSVRRIWADGNLLRGSAGDFKTEIGAFRLHGGGEDQPVDPLIASAEGEEASPAHRGVAYALFEDLALADYGNRIPSLTFEVEADEGAVGVAAIARDASGGAIGGGALPLVDGFAASGADVGEAIEALVDAYGLALCDGADGLRLIEAGTGAEIEIVRDALARRVNGRAVEPEERASGGADRVPVALSLRHYDGARDYQSGVQRVTRPGPGRRELGLDLPAVMPADDARALAATRIGAAWAGRATMTLRCGWGGLALTVGSVVRVEGAPGLWRIVEREWEAMTLRLALRRVAGAGGAMPGGASSGAIVRQDDAPHGPTTLLLADLPSLREGAATTPLLVAAASGGPGWRSAALFMMGDNGEASPIGRSAPRAMMGRVDSGPGEGGALLIDRAGAVIVTLLSEDMALTDADEVALGQGRNLCMVGRELMQFEMATRIGAAQWRLSALRRGLRGTEWAMGAHAADEPFLLIEQDRLVEPLALAGVGAEPGATVRVAALGRGDEKPATAVLTVEAEALRPPSPVHLRATAGAGGVTFSWVRRSRAGWRWASGGDAPLAEEQERYAVRVLDDDRLVRTDEVGAPVWTYTAAMIAADAMGGRAVTVEIAQIGTRAMGRSARLTATV